MIKVEFEVKGMSCGHCKKAIESSLKALLGVESVEVSVPYGTVNVEFNSYVVSLEQIKETVGNQGYYIG